MKVAMLLVWVLFLATAVEALPGGGGRQLTKENANLKNQPPSPPSSPAPSPATPSPPSSPSPSTSEENKPPATSGTWNRCKNECYEAGKCRCDVAWKCKAKANGKADGVNSKAACDKCVAECINP